MVADKFSGHGDRLPQRHCGNCNGVFVKYIATDFDIAEAMQRKRRLEHFALCKPLSGVAVLTAMRDHRTFGCQSVRVTHPDQCTL